MKRFTPTLIAALYALTVSQAQGWNQYHGNAQRTGYTSVAGPSSLNLSWTAPINGPIVSSPVVGPDGTVYIGPVLEETLHPSIAITAVAPDGGIKWVHRRPFREIDNPTLSTPVIDENNNLYVGTPDGKFISLDPSGALRWEIAGSRHVLVSPAIGPEGLIYAVIDGNLKSISPDGTVNWSLLTSDPRQSGGPAIGADGTIFVPGGDGTNGFLVAVSPVGTELWRRQLGQYFYPLAPPTVGPDGTIYTAAQGIYAINPDGSLKWYSEPSYGINGYGSITVDPANNIYYSGYVYIWKLNPVNGAKVWEHTITDNGSSLGHGAGGILADGAGHLIVPLGDGKRSAIPAEKKLLVMNATTGNIQSFFALPEIAGSSAPALVASGAVYSGCLDGNLYAFNAPQPRQTPPTSAVPGNGTIIQGTVEDLATTDGNPVVVRSGLTVNTAIASASLVVEGTAPSSNVSMLKLDLNAATSAGSATLQVQFWNWTTNAYETIRQEVISRLAAEYPTYAVGNLSRFIQPGTLKLRARIAMKNALTVSTVPWREIIDKAVWKTYP